MFPSFLVSPSKLWPVLQNGHIIWDSLHIFVVLIRNLHYWHLSPHVIRSHPSVPSVSAVCRTNPAVETGSKAALTLFMSIIIQSNDTVSITRGLWVHKWPCRARGHISAQQRRWKTCSRGICPRCQSSLIYRCLLKAADRWAVISLRWPVLRPVEEKSPKISWFISAESEMFTDDYYSPERPCLIILGKILSFIAFLSWCLWIESGEKMDALSHSSLELESAAG